MKKVRNKNTFSIRRDVLLTVLISTLSIGCKAISQSPPEQSGDQLKNAIKSSCYAQIKTQFEKWQLEHSNENAENLEASYQSLLGYAYKESDISTLILLLEWEGGQIKLRNNNKPITPFVLSQDPSKFICLLNHGLVKDQAVATVILCNMYHMGHTKKDRIGRCSIWSDEILRQRYLSANLDDVKDANIKNNIVLSALEMHLGSNCQMFLCENQEGTEKFLLITLDKINSLGWKESHALVLDNNFLPVWRGTLNSNHPRPAFVRLSNVIKFGIVEGHAVNGVYAIKIPDIGTHRFGDSSIETKVQETQIISFFDKL